MVKLGLWENRHLFAYSLVRAQEAKDSPIGVCGGSRVPLGRESKSRKQFEAKYSREALHLQVFGRSRRVSEGKLNAQILQSLALQGPTWPYQLQKRVEASVAKGDRVPDHRTFRRHMQELSELGYIRSSKEERHHAGQKRIYTLTEKGKTVALFLPEVQRDLLTFVNLHDTADLPTMPGESWLRLLVEKGMPTVAQYIVRGTNAKMLIYNFEDEEDEGQLRDIRLDAFAGLVVDLINRARRGEPKPAPISEEDAKKFKDVSQNDAEFKRRVKEILQRMKVAMDYFRGNIDYALSILQ